MARAGYARKRFAVVDDVLSGLDASTKDWVFGNIFGEFGLLRQAGCTVILCSNDVSFLPQANHVIVLGKDARIAIPAHLSILQRRLPMFNPLLSPVTPL